MQRYQLLEKIGEGSFGTVLKALSPKNQVVAIKQIAGCNPFQRERVQEEVDIMKRFNHPNLVRVYESFYDQDQQMMHIVMEYCQTDLLQFYRKRHSELTPLEITYIFKEVVQAFTALNEQGIIHRDLKPENVLVTKQGMVKVADFGCARKLQSGSLERIIMSFDKGTATYASPEILKAMPYSSKCDVWSAGCMLFLLVTGKHPFLESNVSKTIKMIEEKTMKKEIALPQEDQMDPTIRYAIKRCLVYSQVERASWRQFSLCRLFSERIGKVKSYLDYLKNLSNIANWLSQTFWTQRKQLGVNDGRDEVLMYFVIKVQCSALELGQRIIDRDRLYSYLFEPGAFQQQELEANYKTEYKEYLNKTKNYLASVRSAVVSQYAQKAIKQRSSETFKFFADIQNSIWAAERVLTNIEQLEKNKLLSIIQRWVSFEKWFDYSQRPTLDKLLDEKSQVEDRFTVYASICASSRS